MRQKIGISYVKDQSDQCLLKCLETEILSLQLQSDSSLRCCMHLDSGSLTDSLSPWALSPRQDKHASSSVD